VSFRNYKKKKIKSIHEISEENILENCFTFKLVIIQGSTIRFQCYNIFHITDFSNDIFIKNLNKK
jgi:hypothetical protein